MEKVIKILPYSYSSLTSFEQCPRKHHGEKLTKEFARPFVQQAVDGDRWHKEAELFALHQTPIPQDNPHAKTITKVVEEERDKGQFHAELELAVRKDLTPCGWWDADCYTRAKLDICVIGETEAVSLDWKTGKADPYSTQLKHSALLLFLHYPNLQKVFTRYVWLKEGYATKGVVHRDFFAEDWAKFEARLAKYKKALDTNSWPAKQSGLCKNYCGVTVCEYNGKFKPK